eukprot:TRINITY_DN5952_c0_g1_i1.p1 TRINITY_DN5952_c0_g1~~TRINITY_DN5952_c0_g1_i1.p1  ORF type:complete len:1155 (+),score=203.37 TRINITY_DN5952_c0_g1_i1:249-3713(+)
MGSKQYDKLAIHLNHYVAEHADQNTELKIIESQLTGLLNHNRLSKSDLLTLSKDLLPPLAHLEQLPKLVVFPLVKLTERTDDPKSARMAHYLLQAALGVGCGGTPMPPKITSKGLRQILQQSDLESTNFQQLWRRAHSSEGSGMEVMCALRHLAAWTISSGNFDEYAKILGQILAQHSQAAAAEQKKGMLGFMARGKEAHAKQAQLTKQAILYGALSALRIGMSEGQLVSRIPKVFHQSILLDRLQEGVSHQDSRIARHSMAILCQLVDSTEKSVLEIVLPCLNQNLLLKTLPGMLETNETQESSDNSSDKKTPPQLNVQDSLCRMYLAKLLGKLLFCSMVGGNVESKRGTVIYMALVVLSTQDPSYTVSMEGIAAMSGATILKNGSLKNGSIQSGSVAEKVDFQKMAEAWQILEKKLLDGDQKVAAPKASLVNNNHAGDDHTKDTLSKRLLQRIISAATHESAGEICAACNAMCVLMKARSFSSMLHGEQHNEQIAHILDDLKSLLWSLVHSQTSVPVTVRCSALSALVWCTKCLSPEQLFQVVRGGYNSTSWSNEYSTRILEQLQQKVAHVEGEELMTTLQLVGALFTGTAAELGVDLLGQTLALVMSQGDQRKRESVFKFMNRFVFELESEEQISGLSSLQPISKQSLARHRCALIRLQCYCVWWLAESVVTGTGDQQIQNLLDDLGQTNQNIPYVHFLAQQQKQNPILGLTIGSLSTCVSVGSWETKCAALRGLALLAVRSCEPFRFQCYSVLKGVSNNFKRRTDQFFHNKKLAKRTPQTDDSSPASVAQFYVYLLDQIYKSSLIIQQLVKRYGGQINRWPEKTEEAVVARHDQLLSNIKQQIQSVVQFPLGERAALLLDLYGDEKDMVQNENFLQRQKTLMQASESQAHLQQLEDEREAAQAEDYYAQPVEDEFITSMSEQNIDVGSQPENASFNQPVQSEQEQYEQQQDYFEDYVEFESGMPLPQEGMVVYSFEGENAGELTVNEGDQVIITGEEEGGWLTVELPSKGEVGLVPQYYVKVIVKEETQIVAQQSNPFANLVQRSYNEEDYEQALEPQQPWQVVEYSQDNPQQQQQQQQQEYQQYSNAEGEEEIQGLIAFDFFAETPGELTAYAGQYVKILAQVDEDWYQVEREGDVGFVPVAFVELVQQ